MLIVSDTSPLSNLGIIGQLSLLQQIYPKVIIPPTVHLELLRLSTITEEITSLITLGWLEIQSVTDQLMLQTLSNSLDPGEAAAITLAIELSADRLLIDERIGRRVAVQYGLKIRGIIGILSNAKTIGLIPELQPLLDKLINQAGFRVSSQLYQQTLRDVNEL